MSDIYVDRVNIERRINDLVDRTGDLDTALAAMPAAPDGGAATSIIAFIAAAGSEAAGIAADSYRALSAITVDVMKDMSLTEAQIEQVFEEIDDQIDEP